MRRRFSQRRLHAPVALGLMAVLNLLLVLLVLLASTARLEDLRAIVLWWPQAEESATADPPLSPPDAPALRVWLDPEGVYLFDPLEGNRLVERFPSRDADFVPWPQVQQALLRYLARPSRPTGVIQLAADPQVSYQLLVEALQALQAMPEPWGQRITLALALQ